MSLAIGHFSLGAAIAIILFRIVDYYSKKITLNQYLKYDLIVVAFGGLWALIPDFPYVFDIWQPLVTGPVCNIFFFHCFLDTIDPNDTVIFSAFLLGVFLIDSFLITWLVTHKKQKNKLKSLVKKQIHI